MTAALPMHNRRRHEAAHTGLASTLKALQSDDSKRRDIGQRASMVCKRNRGATEQTLQAIARLLEAPEITGASLPFPVLHVTATK